MLLLAVYVVLIFSIFAAFPSTRPFLPIRGDALLGSYLLLTFAVLATLFVTFLVVDATTINCLFIRDLNCLPSNWHLSDSSLVNTKFKFLNHLAVLKEEDCADYLDIQYIARSSNTVNRLVYFPFILIALMVAWNWPETDGYALTTMLIVGFVLNALWAAYCAFRLPIEARAARDASLRRLRDKLFVQSAVEAET